MRLLLISALIAILSSTAHSYCFEKAAAFYGLNPDVLRSIAKTESNFKADAVNYNKNGSYDYGLMQINSSWASKLGAERWDGLADPCYNVLVGAWVLAQCVNEFGDSMKAIGCYHSRNKERQKKYARKVLINLDKSNIKKSEVNEKKEIKAHYADNK